MNGVNWHDLPSHDVIHWTIPHLLAQDGRDGVKLQEVMSNGGGLEAAEIVITVNGVEFDGVRLIRDLYASLSSSFDVAVNEVVDERFHEIEMSVEDVMSEVFEQAKAKLKTSKENF
jgi:hypothetical protein